MYEPLILEKKKSGIVSGTPAAKVFVILNLSRIFIYIGGVCLLSNYIIKRKRFIDELNEIEVFSRRSNKFLAELEESKYFWNSPGFQGVVHKVLQKHYEQKTLAENSLNTMSTDIQNK